MLPSQFAVWLLWNCLVVVGVGRHSALCTTCARMSHTHAMPLHRHRHTNTSNHTLDAILPTRRPWLHRGHRARRCEFRIWIITITAPCIRIYAPLQHSTFGLGCKLELPGSHAQALVVRVHTLGVDPGPTSRTTSHNTSSGCRVDDGIHASKKGKDLPLEASLHLHLAALEKHHQDNTHRSLKLPSA